MALPTEVDCAALHRIARSLLMLRVLTAVLVFVVGSIVAYQLGDTTRTKRLLAEQSARIEADVRADCAFKLDIIVLPLVSARPTRVLVQLAMDARAAYVGKRCVASINPATGDPFPPPPKLPPLPPPPSPSR
jgi:hypothetical protein